MPGPEKIKAILEKQGSMHFIPIQANAAASLIKTGSKRVICTINSVHKIHAALIPRKLTGDFYIYAGKALLKKAGITAGDKITVQIEKDDSTYQFDMPEELAEVLDTDSDSHRIFHTLTPGRQRGLIQLVNMVKSTDKKIERSLKIADKIKAGITNPPAILK